MYHGEIPWQWPNTNKISWKEITQITRYIRQGDKKAQEMKVPHITLVSLCTCLGYQFYCCRHGVVIATVIRGMTIIMITAILTCKYSYHYKLGLGFRRCIYIYLNDFLTKLPFWFISFPWQLLFFGIIVICYDLNSNLNQLGTFINVYLNTDFVFLGRHMINRWQFLIFL